MNTLDVTAAGERLIRKVVALRLNEPAVGELVVTLATLGEVHVSGVLDALIDGGADSRSRFDVETLSRLRKDMYGSWKSLFEWLGAGFDLKLSKGDPAAQRFSDCVELRNMIVHGNHNLTRYQLKELGASIKLRERLAKYLDVTFDGNRVIMGQRTAARSMDAIVDFVVYFDNSLLVARPDLRTHGEFVV